jgi:protein involved in ribonucleotide reduction
MMQRKFALRGSNLSRVIAFPTLDEYELYNSTDDEETAREIEEE